MRKLASIREISTLLPIVGADLIETAVVDGWTVVVKKGDYEVGEWVVFLEIDSWVPNSLAPFLSKGEPRVFNDIPGERLRTVKLRGQLSQGLVLPTSVVPFTGFALQDDVTDALGVVKWEPPVSPQMQGVQRRTMPTRIRKTDEERVQNIWNIVDLSERFEITIKLDGSSMTVYKLDGEVGVCSRNIDLKLEQEGNTFVDTAKKLGLLDIVAKLPKDYAIQGELMGPGIQGNREKLNDFDFYCFNIWDCEAMRYLPFYERHAILEEHGIKSVPVLHQETTLHSLGIETLADTLAYAEGPSLNAPLREGLVFKSACGEFSFKAISNKYLLKND
jgi:RNA ligase (TIGR02306 family)